MKLNYYSKRLYYKSEIDETSYDPEVWNRKEILENYAKLRSEGCTQETALKVLCISKSQYYRWRNAYKRHGLGGLEDRSKRPNKIRTPSWSKDLELLVLSLRRKNLMWGKTKIHAVLRRDHSIKTSESTIGRIITKYIKQGKIQPVDFYFKRKFKRARSFNNHAQRWQRGMKAKIPGELLQIDHMSLSPMSEVNIKHFKAVCPVTKITTEQAYGSATSTIASQFLDHVMQTLPFPVHSIQVDGGSEFMGQFEEKCKSLGIPLYVLPPRSPEYNGNVERGNSTVKYEFYAHYLGSFTLSQLRLNLQKYVRSYNSYRPHQALQNLTPLQYYQKISGGSLSHIY